MLMKKSFINSRSGLFVHCVLACIHVLERSHMFFHALTFAGARGSCLNTRPSGRVF